MKNLIKAIAAAAVLTILFINFYVPLMHEGGKTGGSYSLQTEPVKFIPKVQSGRLQFAWKY